MRTKTILGLLIATTLLLAGCSSPEKLNEKWYQERWCAQQGGEAEVRLKDKTRCDCLTADYAIEVDFARKWAEAIGQSLGYAFATNKKAGIVLILESKKDYKYWIKLNSIIDHYGLPIDVWKIEP